MIILDVNAKAYVRLTNALEKIHKSAFPNAVRGTLNRAAFDVKQNTMPTSASRHFIKRRPNFFKANSRVQMASGYQVNTMKSIVGFIAVSGNNYTNYAVRELQQQEYGGEIESRSYIPLKTARSGESPNQMVRPAARLSNIKGIVNSEKAKGRSDKEKFLKSAIFAGKGGFVIGNIRGKKKLYEIKLLNRVKGKDSHRMTRVKTKALYSFDQGRDVGIKPTSFMHEASTISANKLPMFYDQEATRQFARVKV